MMQGWVSKWNERTSPVHVGYWPKATERGGANPFESLLLHTRKNRWTSCSTQEEESCSTQEEEGGGGEVRGEEITNQLLGPM